MKYPKLAGLVAAPYVAFNPDHSLNLKMIEAQAQSLIHSGVTGAFVCGTTGEGVSLTTAEREAVAARWCEVAGSHLRVIVHVGHTSLTDSRNLAKHAQKIGAAGISNLAPFFFKPANTVDLVEFCAEVAAAAPDLPYYYYQIPSMTGVSLPAADFLRVAQDRIPNLAGVKFTFENLMDFAECTRMNNGGFDVVFGRDEILLAGLSLGATSAIGSTYNFAAPLYLRILRAFAAGDLLAAQAEQARANAMISILLRFGGLPSGKSIMRLIGLDCGQVRLPLRSLSEASEKSLRNDLEKIGFFEFCSVR
ncbi:MAG: dihydrodipicolinate synthetase [Verrucomicrobia bacterium]|nr:dihydrodipicolinate synthetase [Verrucomicrobiota bacterium]